MLASQADRGDVPLPSWLVTSPGWRSIVVAVGCLISGVCVWALLDFVFSG
jgi:hypothetical protein